MRLASCDQVEGSLTDCERELDAALKLIDEQNGFSLADIREAQQADRALLAAAGFVEGFGTFHDNWSTLDQRRCSAACAIEWHRLRLFALGEVFAELQLRAAELTSFSFTDPKTRRAIGGLQGFGFKRFRRKVRRAFRETRALHPSFMCFSVIGVAVLADDEVGVLFEPHIRILANCDASERLQVSLGRVFRAPPSGRPLRPQAVGSIADLGRLLDGMFRPPSELQAGPKTDVAGQPRRPVGPHEDLVAVEYLAWLAEHRVADFTVSTGLRPSLMQKLHQARMLEIGLTFLQQSRMLLVKHESNFP